MKCEIVSALIKVECTSLPAWFDCYLENYKRGSAVHASFDSTTFWPAFATNWTKCFAFVIHLQNDSLFLHSSERASLTVWCPTISTSKCHIAWWMWYPRPALCLVVANSFHNRHGTSMSQVTRQNSTSSLQVSFLQVHDWWSARKRGHDTLCWWHQILVQRPQKWAAKCETLKSLKNNALEAVILWLSENFILNVPYPASYRVKKLDQSN